MTMPLSVFFGALVGFALGLTGGGGSLLAVPLLVYGLAMAPREAFGVSLAAVGATALFGVVQRLRARQVEIGVGLFFAGAGMVGAPLGTLTARHVSEPLLLTLFAVLMLIVAVRMWRAASTGMAAARQCAPDRRRPACRRSPDGKLRLDSRCAVLLAVVGLATGFLSGMFGVGGGFVIVPALVLFSGMAIHRAIATSLLVIVLVSVSGVASHFAAGRGVPLDVTALFVVGGAAGMALGGVVSKYFSPIQLQRVFATGIVAVAALIVGKTYL